MDPGSADRKKPFSNVMSCLELSTRDHPGKI